MNFFIKTPLLLSLLCHQFLLLALHVPYIFDQRNVTFSTAVSICAQYSATVLIMDSVEEENFIKELYLSQTARDIWLAAYDVSGNETNVNYYTNQSLIYTSPRNEFDFLSQRCMRYSNDTWKDTSCTASTVATVCKLSKHVYKQENRAIVTTATSTIKTNSRLQCAGMCTFRAQKCFGFDYNNHECSLF